MMDKVNEILVVDDNAADVRLLTALCPPQLGSCNFHVAYDGEMALDYVHKRGKFSKEPIPCLILLDLNLPRKSGTEVLAEIRASGGLSEIPVIVLSGSGNPKDRAECLALGANQYVTKPRTLEGMNSLFDLVSEYMNLGCGK